MYKKILTFVLAGFVLAACGSPKDLVNAPAELRATTSVTPSSQTAKVGIPKRLEIPAIKVNAPVIPVGLLANTDMETPKKKGDTGWYKLGKRPGEIGTSIINGHVDTEKTADVFYKLRNLARGDEVLVTDSANNSYLFRVTAINRYDKDEVPWEKLLREDKKSVLYLVTCGGEFNRTTGHYEDNWFIKTELV